ncbi:MAG: hypothetical protein R3A45_04650 [Bdellovibrionota bacterium]
MFSMILLTALQLDIAQAITKAACSDLPESSIIEKLQNVEKFELIDDEKSFYYDAFYEAEILHSTYKGAKNERKIINFVIKPAPLITFSEAVAKKKSTLIFMLHVASIQPKNIRATKSQIMAKVLIVLTSHLRFAININNAVVTRVNSCLHTTLMR